ncbi:twitching motility protein PilT [Rhodothermaceae bacterium RA]|nr:twitching motility protein PilT [Rhodothermaceae bacterium RA]
MRILFDTNVVLDVLLERNPFVRPASLLFEAVERRKITGLLCATTLTTIDYLVARARDRDTARQGVAWLMQGFEVAPVNRAVLANALSLNFDDFEDAVLHEAARLAGADGLVTRNAPDFRAATLSVYTPAELLAALA